MVLDSSIVTSSLITELERYDDLVSNKRSLIRHKASDIRPISHLGDGAFCTVSLVESEPNGKQLAMKFLDEEKIESTAFLHRAATDLIMEAHYLSKLDHPNIIKIHGVSATPFARSFKEDEQSYFITLDVMEETLRDRIPKWYDDKASFNTKKGGLRRLAKSVICKRRPLNLQSMYNRIETAALGIAEAMKYIHGQGIIVRDLKPGNVGFHKETGKVCLLDFGFARELSLCSDDEICGTPRYMAPELLNGGSYSLKTDVYSFGIMLHEIASLEHSWRPKRRSISSHVELLTACDTLVKPSTENIPCRDTALLIEDCISEDPEARPSFESICIALKDFLSSAPTKDNFGGLPIESELAKLGADIHDSISTLPDFSESDELDLDPNLGFNASAQW